MKRVEEIAEKILRKGGAVLGAVKHLLNEGRNVDFSAGLDLGLKYVQEYLRNCSDDIKGLCAVGEK
jgi:hypothetical protein